MTTIVTKKNSALTTTNVHVAYQQRLGFTKRTLGWAATAAAAISLLSHCAASPDSAASDSNSNGNPEHVGEVAQASTTQWTDISSIYTNWRYSNLTAWPSTGLYGSTNSDDQLGLWGIRYSSVPQGDIIYEQVVSGFISSPTTSWVVAYNSSLSHSVDGDYSCAPSIVASTDNSTENKLNLVSCLTDIHGNTSISYQARNTTSDYSGWGFRGQLSNPTGVNLIRIAATSYRATSPTYIDLWALGDDSNVYYAHHTAPINVVSSGAAISATWSKISTSFSVDTTRGISAATRPGSRNAVDVLVYDGSGNQHISYFDVSAGTPSPAWYVPANAYHTHSNMLGNASVVSSYNDIFLWGHVSMDSNLAFYPEELSWPYCWANAATDDSYPNVLDSTIGGTFPYLTYADYLTMASFRNHAGTGNTPSYFLSSVSTDATPKLQWLEHTAAAESSDRFTHGANCY